MDIALRHIILTPSRPVLATPFYAERQAGEQQVPFFNVFRYDAAGMQPLRADAQTTPQRWPAVYGVYLP